MINTVFSMSNCVHRIQYHRVTEVYAPSWHTSAAWWQGEMLPLTGGIDVKTRRLCRVTKSPSTLTPRRRHGESLAPTTPWTQCHLVAQGSDSAPCDCTQTSGSLFFSEFSLREFA
jgi:hypothetical protein